MIEVSEAEAQEINKNPKDHLISAGKILKRSAKPVKPAENVLIPKIDNIELL